MDKLVSPDLPAYWCYIVVIVLGLITARSNVNRILSNQRGYWAFPGTWLLLAAYSVLPLVLFWFLDYTTAIKDTSLFAAFVIAVAYQQVFAGGVQGIVMPGQTSGLWQPFEKWTQTISTRIAISSKRSRDAFDEQVNSYIIADSGRVAGLQSLALEYSDKADQLQTDLNNISTQEPPTGTDSKDFEKIKTRKRVRVLVDNLRAARPQSFGDLLRERKLVKVKDYWRWFRNLESNMIAWSMAVLLALVGAVTVPRADDAP